MTVTSSFRYRLELLTADSAKMETIETDDIGVIERRIGDLHQGMWFRVTKEFRATLAESRITNSQIVNHQR